MLGTGIDGNAEEANGPNLLCELKVLLADQPEYNVANRRHGSSKEQDLSLL